MRPGGQKGGRKGCHLEAHRKGADREQGRYALGGVPGAGADEADQPADGQ